MILARRAVHASLREAFAFSSAGAARELSASTSATEAAAATSRSTSNPASAVIEHHEPCSSSPNDVAVAPGWLSRGIKVHPKAAKQRSSWWTRKGPDGQPVPIRTWEKIYWGLGAAGLALLIVPRVQQYFRKDDSEERARKELEKQDLVRRRMLMIPTMVAGGSFLDGEDAKLYEGLSPKEINALGVAKFGGTGSKEDPFEGMSPEEIDAMFGAADAPTQK